MALTGTQLQEVRLAGEAFLRQRGRGAKSEIKWIWPIVLMDNVYSSMKSVRAGKIHLESQKSPWQKRILCKPKTSGKDMGCEQA